MSQPRANFIFEWRKSQWNYRLPVLVAISFFAHVFCFYIFRVVYPTTTSLLPPSAQITVLDPHRPQDQGLLDWVAANDPAKLSAPRFNPSLIGQITPRYKPIYSSLSVELKRAEPPEPKSLGMPSLFSAETLLPMRSRPQKETAPKTFSTRCDVASALQSRAPDHWPVLPTNSALSDPTSLFVGVNPEGEVDYVFLMRSSENYQLDQKAEDFIRTVKFKPGSGRNWGMVTLHWGANQP
jgi:TonB family protein